VPVAGRSRRASCPTLTACPLRFAILAALAPIARLLDTGSPSQHHPSQWDSGRGSSRPSKPNAVRRGANRQTMPHPAWLARGLTAGRLVFVQAQRREAWGAARSGLGPTRFARGLTAGRLVFVQAQRREAWGAARSGLGPTRFARGLTAGRLSCTVHSSVRINCEPYHKSRRRRACLRPAAVPLRGARFSCDSWTRQRRVALEVAICGRFTK